MRGFSHFSTNVLDDKPPPNPLLEKRRGKLNAANNLVLQDKNQDLLLFLDFTGQQWLLLLVTSLNCYSYKLISNNYELNMFNGNSMSIANKDEPYLII